MPLTTPIGYVPITFCESGIVTPVTLVPALLTSVTYTIPASASPRVTFDSTALTFSSFDAGLTLTFAFAKAWAANLPHGTASAQSTSTTPGFARSANEVMCFGFPGSTAIASRLRANVAGEPATWPAAASF